MISAVKPTTCTLVVSKGQSRNPAKRGLESAIAQAAGQLDGVEVIMVPHLYDLPKGGESLELLQKIEGDLIVCSWIFSRAAHWVLDRNGIGGATGEVELGADEDDEEELSLPDSESSDSAGDEPEAVDRVTDLYPRPDRTIHCLDLKVSESVDDFIGEIKRILNIAAEPDQSLPIVGGKIVEVDETTSRRWYPVIDFSRCTNCMECIDFCLFGVYGVDGVENILVEQPDNCRKGCPACSRVCPENAIIFPQHKAPAIAGAETEGDEGFKIDLSQLFGAPTDKGDPIATAARERDEQLLLTGREAVGIDDNLKKRQAALSEKPKDNLDRLIDSLDELDL
ncbi:4Fe-4S ferredoxin, iron-sulfur binding domain protein [Rhodopirellula islandica]|uniref:4Fe-4S ferredoxin, iron-sulfur binding domain protein n=1 Tax=Rhodopirellula islandica TaxID=595434 RepID=A0A0J1BBH9_RHOIS|nr:ferredoxin family protein [Rhodopirellula islandica]KLU04005.1 4Fe-4S ferredoxin, iron-sulfur binding domain protein [Rhodopirellula islandica]